MKTNRTDLVALYNTAGTAVKVHAPDCRMLNTAKGRNVIAFPWTQEEADDLAERGFRVTICKCAK